MRKKTPGVKCHSHWWCWIGTVKVAHHCSLAEVSVRLVRVKLLCVWSSFSHVQPTLKKGWGVMLCLWRVEYLYTWFRICVHWKICFLLVYLIIYIYIYTHTHTHTQIDSFSDFELYSTLLCFSSCPALVPVAFQLPLCSLSCPWPVTVGLLSVWLGFGFVLVHSFWHLSLLEAVISPKILGSSYWEIVRKHLTGGFLCAVLDVKNSLFLINS